MMEGTTCVLALLSLFVTANLDGTVSAESDKSCLQGPYHVKEPVAVPKSKLLVCDAWHEAACCNQEFTKELSSSQTEKLYNFTWHRCGRLSKACERYWYNEECFYQCSPYIHKWENPSKTGAAIGIPICASYCDRWFDACETYLICVENVLTDYNFTITGHNFCPKHKMCITYKQMYGNSKALCEKMWGNTFLYQEENEDSSNCMVMWFSGNNPNRLVKKPSNEQGRSRAYSTLTYVAAMFSCLVLLQV